MDRFWPGALTLVLPADPGVHPAVTGGGDTVGLRVPDHPVPRALAALLSGAVTGTSANRSGNPGAWRSAEEIVREFTGAVDWVLWGAPRPTTSFAPMGYPRWEMPRGQYGLRAAGVPPQQEKRGTKRLPGTNAGKPPETPPGPPWCG